MPVEPKGGFTGLFTNVAETQAPPGALLEAENVVIRRPGCIEARDGVELAATVAGGFAAYGFSWRSKDIFARNNNSNVFDWRDTGGNAYAYSDIALGLVNPQPFRRDIFSHAESRANLYLPYDSGVLKLDTDAVTNWKMAGLPMFGSINSLSMSTSGTWLPTASRVSYRIVCTKKDANGVIVSSLPSGALSVDNTSGGDRAVSISVTVNNHTLVDYIEVYRTRTFTTSVTPDDEMRLVAVIPSALSITHVDLVSDAARGRALYTSPSREGIANQNERPPACAVTASFKGSLFFGNTRGPRRIKISRNISGDVSGSATGIGYREYTATSTSGSANLTGLSSTVGLEKGMIVSGTGITLGTYVTNISGTTVTMSATSSASATTTYRFTDAIKISGTWAPAAGSATYFASVVFGYAPAMQIYALTPPEEGYAYTDVIETITRSSVAQTIQATHGGEYSPVLPGYDATPLALAQDAWPGAIYWSKTDEPEHVAPANYAFVGDQRKAILALAPTRDALYLLKEDGIWRLTGVNGEWRIDPMDPTTFCVLPSSVRSLNGRVIFLGNRGVVAMGDGGMQLLSGPINDQVKLVIDQVTNNFLSTGFYELTGVQGANTSAVYEREGEYSLMRSSTDTILVYNENTNAWVTWVYHALASESYSYKALFYFSRTSKLVYAFGGDYYTTILSPAAGANYQRYDRANAITVNSYAGGTATLSASAKALQDDIIEDANENFWRVTADVDGSATLPVVLGGGTASMATGAGFLYRAQRCKVVPMVFSAPPSNPKRWTTITTAFTRLNGPVILRYAYISSMTPMWSEEEAAIERSEGYAQYDYGYSSAGLVPMAHARAWLLRARIRWALAFGQVRLEGVSAESVTLSARSGQQVSP